MPDNIICISSSNYHRPNLEGDRALSQIGLDVAGLIEREQAGTKLHDVLPECRDLAPFWPKGPFALATLG